MMEFVSGRTHGSSEAKTEPVASQALFSATTTKPEVIPIRFEAWATTPNSR